MGAQISAGGVGWRRVVTLLFAATVGLGAVPAQAAVAAAPGAYTVFNNPTASTPDYRIESDLVSLVDGAPAGSEIHGEMFTWTRTPVATALKNAQARGVKVYLAVDREGSGGANLKPDNEAIKILKGAGLTRLVFCGNASYSSCISNRTGAINHNKVFMFSKTKNMTNAVWVASFNLTNSQNSQFNNAVVVHGDKPLYDFFDQHLDTMLNQKRTADYNKYFRSDTAQVRAYLSPRADSSGGTSAEHATDTVAQVLKYVKFESGCTVDVAHAQFTGPRKPVIDELIRVGKLGCKVRVLIGENLSQYVSDALKGQTNITVRQLPNLHSKYIVVKSHYNDAAKRQLVFTGSHNLTGPALRTHDETLIRVERPEVSKAYSDNFAAIWPKRA
ncbi:phospholipase D-like domain-containing protein [Allokutzneria albata]|uniref:phospholipase D n=1 Tax=Allokutzneria albata TaxID=211114 RepID=A0A1H0BCW4_ALLAB|nr:phospholipase D-like domain-containing protein [Allokutzneria albata]SDN43445.1 PLD-like domain-containing protein [Allokutzneria albata]